MGAGKVIVIDSMGGDLGLAMTASCLRPFREAIGVPSERVEPRRRPDWRALLASIERGDVAGVIFTGSKAGVYEKDAWIADLLGFARDLVALEPRAPVPVLGICFGHQLLAEATAGPGAVEARPPVRCGVVEVERTGEAPIFEGIPRRFRTVIAHQDHVTRVAPEFEVIARADYTPIHAVRHRAKPIWSVQGHPEHCRATFDVDEREYAHRAWAAIGDAELAAAEAPRVLGNFARIVAGL